MLGLVLHSIILSWLTLRGRVTDNGFLIFARAAMEKSETEVREAAQKLHKVD